MKRPLVVSALVVQALLVVGLVPAIRSGLLPLGLPGEWEWSRVDVAVAWPDLILASAGVAAFAAFAAAGSRALAAGSRAWPWVLALVPASAGVQLVVLSGAPAGYGLTKWAIALHSPGASGYYTTARREIRDLPAFLAAYPGWIRGQDALHIGTHPPGLFVTSWAMLRLMEANPGLARVAVGMMPESLAMGFRQLARFDALPAADRAALAATGLLTLLACAATAGPLYALASSGLPPPAAWAAAALWPLTPAAILFGPAADTAFPFLSTSALALAAHAGRRGLWLAVAAGVVLGVGMQFTLAFLPVGLAVAFVLISERSSPWRRRALAILATGLGFLGLTAVVWAATRGNPFVIWWCNQANHARFYVEFPRSYLAWVMINPVETAVAIGLPAATWVALGLRHPRSIPRAAAAALAVLVILNVSGRNLSEVARLWLPLMPPLLLLAARGMGRPGDDAGPPPTALAVSVALTGFQTLALQTAIQVVYPF